MAIGKLFVEVDARLALGLKGAPGVLDQSISSPDQMLPAALLLLSLNFLQALLVVQPQGY